MTAAVVDGPAWARQGLVQRAGRYPLAVEAPVLSMVDTLVPGVSTLTRFARYYSLYWALADLAARRNLDAEGCQRAIRRAELLLALVCDTFDNEMGQSGQAHGVDSLNRLFVEDDDHWKLAELGSASYSPRAWGFWSQYGGPSDALGTVRTERGALRPSRHPCPVPVREMFEPLLDPAAGLDSPPITGDLLSGMRHLALGEQAGADLPALRELFTATRRGTHDPDDWKGADRTRRAAFRIVARSAFLEPETDNRMDALRRAVAYGPAAGHDPVLAAEERTMAWRGLLLRHHSVGAWRRLWAGLVAHVQRCEVATRQELHDWISAELPDQTVSFFERNLPAVVDGAGHPAPAEDEILSANSGVHGDVAVLIIGAQRPDTLTGIAHAAFLGGRRSGRGAFLDPNWVARRVAEHRDRSVGALGRAIVDDMLAQSRRVALRKVDVRDGQLRLFTRLHERNGVYVALSGEGAGNVGLRIEQLAGIAEQLGLMSSSPDAPITGMGQRLLGVRA